MVKMMESVLQWSIWKHKNIKSESAETNVHLSVHTHTHTHLQITFPKALSYDWEFFMGNKYIYIHLSFSFFLNSVSSVTQSCLTLCDPMDCSTPCLPVHHQLLELAQTHVHWVGDSIQPSHLLSSPSPPAFNLAQHQGLFKWVSSSHQVAKVLEFQLQHQSFQWIFGTHFF